VEEGDVMEDGDEARTDAALFTPCEVLERLATLPRRYAEGELRIEIQQPANGAPFLSLRVWKPDGSTDVPYRGQGCSFWADELVVALGAFAKALDWFQERERRDRRALERGARERPEPRLRRGARARDDGPPPAA
jgi:hypothetical protein